MKKRLFKLALLVAVIAGLAKFIEAQKAAWTGLTEPELRDKLHTKLDDKMPSEKVDEIGDKVVEGMRKRGMVGEEAAKEETSDAE
jgi:hypothetical protein